MEPKSLLCVEQIIGVPREKLQIFIQWEKNTWSLLCFCFSFCLTFGICYLDTIFMLNNRFRAIQTLFFITLVYLFPQIMVQETLLKPFK